ncbi:MAG: glycosyltransferase family 4 protein [Saprospiraceae bacterium]|nr:glycosyltransferase family 4 protein [Saprospiraceae bacterium]MCF8250709.1 glycosyltransferase family 4 protein [Saprospiraceae bacterium]MCF8279765.1 glycosyltransferase family 4 protein [Bacteroidales bacterium]MCF8310529.1 glycosyltransferase family 4 protein [Saprospiraceae bacterium]MCF8440839.1 glycosyltransferase family 4 protein [Saprospiraceae bacterium]
MKKTVLITAYAVNPRKGSEDGIGWNIIRHLARHSDVVAITRRNNRLDIEGHLADHPFAEDESLRFEYFDLPRWAAFWKRGGQGALLYHYLWHLGVAFFIMGKKWRYDLAHHLNFNSDWSPSFLWLLGKPYVWGPVGHHPKIPSDFLLPYGKKAWRSDRLRWWAKCFFWQFDPFLAITKRTAAKVIGLNSSVGKVLRLPSEKIVTMPAIASELPESQQVTSNKFRVLSVGRFVPLKGFDVTVRAFAQFYQKQNTTTQSRLELVLIGKGPERERLQSIAEKHGLPDGAVRFVHWVERAELPRFFASSSAFLFPSHEGGGMVVAEAMGFGLPVLCFDNEGPGENVDETCGVKVAYSLGYEGAVTAFAQAMERLLHEEGFQQKLSVGARRYFAKNFIWDIKAERIAAVYEAVLSPSNAVCLPLAILRPAQ